MEVKEKEDGSFEITWDPDDPVESVFNTWSEEDFTKCIMDAIAIVTGKQIGRAHV